MSDMINRRTLLSGLVSALAAPAIVKAASIMPVRNGLIMIGRGSHSVTGITMAGKLIKEFVDPYEWTKTRWMKVFDVGGSFPVNIIDRDIVNANTAIRESAYIEGVKRGVFTDLLVGARLPDIEESLKRINMAAMGYDARSIWSGMPVKLYPQAIKGTVQHPWPDDLAS